MLLNVVPVLRSPKEENLFLETKQGAGDLALSSRPFKSLALFKKFFKALHHQILSVLDTRHIVFERGEPCFRHRRSCGRGSFKLNLCGSYSSRSSPQSRVLGTPLSCMTTFRLLLSTVLAQVRASEYLLPTGSCL